MRFQAFFLLCWVLVMSAAPREIVSQKNMRGRNVVTLEDLRDRSRPLLIFAAKPDDTQMQMQLRILEENAPGVSERDITVLALPYHAPSASAQTMSESEADAARRRFRVAPPEFTVILIGKDGGEKLRSRKPLSFDRLRETIDAMPIRQDEMRRQKSK